MLYGTFRGCRSFLTADRYTDKGLGNIEKRKNYDGKHQYYGRGNMGVVTLNLADLGLSAHGDMDLPIFSIGIIHLQRKQY